MSRTLVFSALVAALAGFLFGFDTAAVSGSLRFLQSQFLLSDSALGFTVSIALIGTIVGSLVAGKAGDRHGRKPMLQVCGGLFAVCAGGSAFASTWPLLLCARFVGGVGIGCATVIVPLYIAEISPGAIRGRLVAIMQLSIVAGILCAFVSDYLLLPLGASCWRWMFAVMLLPAVLYLALLRFIPESPRWLAARGRPDLAGNTLRWLRSPHPDDELRAILATLREEHTAPPLFQRRYRLAVLCAILLAMFNQLSGINIVMYYSPMIFERLGLGTDAALVNSVIIGLTNLLFTAAAMALIDRFGRKVLLMVGGTGMMLSLASAAWAMAREGVGSVGLLLSIIAFIASFAFSQGTVIWVFLSEIFPNAVRAKGQALGAFVHWVTDAALAWVFPVVLVQVGGGAAFIAFSLLMVPFLIFVGKMVPETKGKSLEELEQLIAPQG